MKHFGLISVLVCCLLAGCGSSDDGAVSGGPASAPATPEEQQAAQAKLGTGAVAPGKEDRPTGGMAPNTPGNEMPADTLK